MLWLKLESQGSVENTSSCQDAWKWFPACSNSGMSASEAYSRLITCPPATLRTQADQDHVRRGYRTQIRHSPTGPVHYHLPLPLRIARYDPHQCSRALSSTHSGSTFKSVRSEAVEEKVINRRIFQFQPSAMTLMLTLLVLRQCVTSVYWIAILSHTAYIGQGGRRSWRRLRRKRTPTKSRPTIGMHQKGTK